MTAVKSAVGVSCNDSLGAGLSIVLKCFLRNDCIFIVLRNTSTKPNINIYYYKQVVSIS